VNAYESFKARQAAEEAIDQAALADLLQCGLRYCAVADWFEDGLGDATQTELDAFNQIEAQLREAGARALRRHGRRVKALRDAGVTP
jgi:uncharacterized glyoxalase superfamily metalloenzyme YdcJ